MRYRVIRFVVPVSLAVMTLASCSQKPSAQSYVDEGLQSMTQENYEEAVTAFNSAIELEADNAEALCGRAEAYLQNGDIEPAYQDYLAVKDVLDEEASSALVSSFKEAVEMTYEDPAEKYQWFIDHPGIADESELEPPVTEEVITLDTVPESLISFLYEYGDVFGFAKEADENRYRYISEDGPEKDLLGILLYLAYYKHINLPYEEAPLEESGMPNPAFLQSNGWRNVMKYSAEQAENMLRSAFGCPDDYIALTQSEPWNCSNDYHDYGYSYNNGGYYFYLLAGNFGLYTDNVTVTGIAYEDGIYTVDCVIDYIFSYDTDNYRNTYSIDLKHTEDDQWTILSFTTKDSQIS